MIVEIPSWGTHPDERMGFDFGPNLNIEDWAMTIPLVQYQYQSFSTLSVTSVVGDYIQALLPLNSIKIG